MDFVLNGEPVSIELREDERLLEVLREQLRPLLGEGRLRARRLVRGMHRDRRRACGRVVRTEGGARRGEVSRDAGGTVGGDAPPLGRVLRRGRRVTVRLLLARDRDEGGGAPGEASGADPRGDRARAARQSLPLHRLREDRRRDPARGGRAPRPSRCPSRNAAAASARAARATRASSSRSATSRSSAT